MVRFLAQFRAVVSPFSELGEVVGHKGIFGIEARTPSGEIPVVLTVIVHTGPIADKVLIIERYLSGRLRAESVAVVQVVPTQTELQVEATQVEVDRYELCLRLVVADVIVALTFDIHVYIVAIEGVTQLRTGEEARMSSNLTACKHTFTQSQGDIGVDGDSGLQRDIEAYLHCRILLGVETEAGMQLQRLAITG